MENTHFADTISDFNETEVSYLGVFLFGFSVCFSAYNLSCLFSDIAAVEKRGFVCRQPDFLRLGRADIHFFDACSDERGVRARLSHRKV